MNNSESEVPDTESEDGDDAEAEYLIEFEQSKKLRVIINDLQKIIYFIFIIFYIL